MQSQSLSPISVPGATDPSRPCGATEGGRALGQAPPPASPHLGLLVEARQVPPQHKLDASVGVFLQRGPGQTDGNSLTPPGSLGTPLHVAGRSPATTLPTVRAGSWQSPLQSLQPTLFSSRAPMPGLRTRGAQKVQLIPHSPLKAPAPSGCGAAPTFPLHQLLPGLVLGTGPPQRLSWQGQWTKLSPGPGDPLETSVGWAGAAGTWGVSGYTRGVGTPACSPGEQVRMVIVVG